MEQGNLSINSENFLPIIKKWLYSDTDIFVRELVSNGADAVTKLKKLISLGEADNVSPDEDFRITVKLDKANKKIYFEDNGIGMTEEEVKKYINEIAFSGATDFVQKYENASSEDGDIIGHFGLGFYSAFMVGHTVTIDTLSYKEGSKAVKWVCDGGITYEIGESERTTRGTTITLDVMEEEESFLDAYRLREILDKYCKYIPVDIYFEEIKEEEETEEIEGTTEDSEPKEVEVEKPVNNKNPLWNKKPSECTDEEYKAFYKEVFHDFNEPLFWIHLNMDYPFNLKGILYFPKLSHELESIEGQVKLYNNQVFIADNIKEVIPEFLLLLKGVIDCPDLPLNVSRSFLQNDGYVTKMSAYITKKVADKLNSLCKSEREQYNKYWDDISPFIKYGVIRQDGFYDKIKNSLLFKSTVKNYYTTDEYMDKFSEKTDKQIYYTNNELLHSQYIKMYQDTGVETVLLTAKIDNPYISYLENFNQEVKFKRVDSDITSSLTSDEKASDEDIEGIKEIFSSVVNADKTDISVESLKDESIPAIVVLSEDSRRMEEMSKMFGGMMMGMPNMPTKNTLTLNSNNKLVKYLLENKDNADKAEENKIITEQIYDLALMSNKRLSPDEMNKFMDRNNKILSILADI